MKIIISGGGTGGHVYPAIAIADAFRQIDPATEILFVGAEGKMEMNAVPKAGYKIIGLPISGLQRSLSMRNVSLVFKLASSLFKAWNIIGNFKPDAVIGVGGYASGPVLKVAAWRKIPYFIQEQNSYAGITNKLLGNRASAIFVAFKGMERFFPKDKIILAGNPVRNDFYICHRGMMRAGFWGSIRTKEPLAYLEEASVQGHLMKLYPPMPMRLNKDKIFNCCGR
ncbi:MAG: glycosyltransferase [Saprospiraceae bacterium]